MGDIHHFGGCSDKPLILEIHNIQGWSTNIKVEGHAFQSEFHTRNIYKISRCGCKAYMEKKDKIYAYLDVWLVWEESPQRCLEALGIVQKKVQRFSFILNLWKLILIPSQTVKWLGLIWDMWDQSVSLISDFQERAWRCIEEFCRSWWITRRKVKRLTGLLKFAMIIRPVGKNLFKQVNSWLRTHVLIKKEKDVIHSKLWQKVKRWLQPRLLNQKVRWRVPVVFLDICMDASQRRWDFI